MQPDPISFLSLLDEHAAKHHHLSRNSRGEVVNAVRVTPGRVLDILGRKRAA
jgi:hypothetical protein